MSTACRFLFIITTLIHYSAAASCGTRKGEYVWDGSTEISIPTNITEFQENLNGALDQLPTNVTKISLYSSAAVYYGFDPNAAYAEARCIGYVDFNTCQECIQNATQVIKDDCSENVISAILWYGDNCMVRYSNHDMFGKMQMPDKMIRIQINSSFSSTTTWFNESRSQLFNVLAEKAEARSDGYQMRAAGKWTDYSCQEMIYGVAQCSPDLYSSECSDCLAIVGQNLEMYFHAKLGGSIVGPSCNFHYEVYPFIDNALLFVDFSPPPPPPPSPLQNLFPPSPWIFNQPFTGKGSKKALPLTYIVALFLIISII